MSQEYYIVKFTIFKSDKPKEKIEVDWQRFGTFKDKEAWIKDKEKEVFENNNNFEFGGAWGCIWGYKFKEYDENTILDCPVKKLGDLSLKDLIKFSNLIK